MADKKITAFESASLSFTKLQVKRLNAQLEEEELEYTLVLDFNAIAKALQHTGRDLTDIRNWENISGPEVSTVCWCAFNRFHPDVTLEQVREMLSPAQSNAVCDMLLEMCFPGVLAKIAEAVARLKNEGDSANPTGAVGT
jgi:hypothetical protein